MNSGINAFIRFLKENNCYKSYIDNFKKETNNLIDLNDLYCSYNPKYIIRRSFDWISSNQGYDYWMNLSDKWEIIYSIIPSKKCSVWTMKLKHS